MLLAEPFCLSGPSADPLPRFRVDGASAPGRARVENFIRQVYAQHYGAVLRQFKPTLASLDDDGMLCAAAGYRSAEAPLFVERYLALPIEQAIALHGGQQVARGAIVEVGHFASLKPGEGRRLMAHLGRHLAQAGFQWVVSTATRELRVIFERLRIRPIVLGRADPTLLGDEAADWGTYYEHAPLVMAGEIHSNLARFLRLPAA